MSDTVDLSCSCGHTRLAVTGMPMLSVACCCTSCRTAGARTMALPGAATIVDEKSTTPFVLYRKDRVAIVAGGETLREMRLSPEAKTRRVVATCCNTPLFLEFQSGHWLSLYATLWPHGSAPPLQMRTMAKDHPHPDQLPNDVPNAPSQSFGFMTNLMGAWIKMGFRVPKLPTMATLVFPEAPPKT